MVISVIMFVSRKKVQICLSISANIPGLNVSNLQIILTPFKVTKGVKRSLGVFRVGGITFVRFVFVLL